MARVLLAWELGGGAGHCAKLAPIAEGLLARGHEVWFAARHLATAKRACAGLNVRCLQAPFLTTPPVNPTVPTRSFAHVLSCSGFGDLAQLEAIVEGWHNLFASIRPDLVICDHAPTALLASRGHEHRRIAIGTGFTLPPAVRPFPPLEYWSNPVTSHADIARDENAVLGRVNELLARYRQPRLGCLADLFAQVDESFLLCFAELDHYPRRENAEHWGSILATGGSPPEWPSDKRPRLFAYLKPPSAGSRLAEFLAFVREARLSSVVYMPDADPRLLRRLESPRLRFVTEPVDLAYAAGQCDVAVLNGGPGSVAACLLAGVPQLNIPLFLEQMVTARRVADLGAGLIAPPSRPELMSARLLMVLHNRRHRSAAQAFARRYADHDVNRVVTGILEKVGNVLAGVHSR